MTSESVWPCTLAETEDSGNYSIVCSDFGRFEHLTKGDAGGYFVERLVKKLAKQKNSTLLRRVKFDSEAGMFCAYGTDLEALRALAALLREASGDSEEEARAEAAAVALPDYTAFEASLLAGFVTGLDPAAQHAFFVLAPRPR